MAGAAAPLPFVSAIATSTWNHSEHSSPTQWGRLGGGRGTNARLLVCGDAPTMVLPHCVGEETGQVTMGQGSVPWTLVSERDDQECDDRGQRQHQADELR